jgi:hypothetical protein
VEGSLVYELEAAFVAVEEAELGLGGEIAEGSVHAGELASGGLLLHGVFEHFGFEDPGAAEAPVGSGELLDEAVFEIVDGVEALEEDVAEALKWVADSLPMRICLARRLWRVALAALPSAVTVPVALARLGRRCFCEICMMGMAGSRPRD